MNISEIELRKIVRKEIQKLQERKEYTVDLARAYHVAMDQRDYDELGKQVDRKKFKKYFRIPKDADEDPDYKRDPRFNIKKLNRIKEESINEYDRGLTPNDLLKELGKVNNIVIKILKKYEKSIGNYMPDPIQKWMMGLHKDIKKQGYRV